MFAFAQNYLDKSLALLYYKKYVGGIAQLGERLNGIQEVSGSIPLISTKRKLCAVTCVTALILYMS